MSTTATTSSQQNTTCSKMSKQIIDECQFAINMFKANEMAMKNQLDLVEKIIQQRKSFRSLSLLIEQTRAQEKKSKSCLRTWWSSSLITIQEHQFCADKPNWWTVLTDYSCKLICWSFGRWCSTEPVLPMDQRWCQHDIKQRKPISPIYAGIKRHQWRQPAPP